MEENLPTQMCRMLYITRAPLRVNKIPFQFNEVCLLFAQKSKLLVR